ncbi:cyclic phosphodiesterase-like [Actinidia eriantha]|uniref:cyclic phosphodiesterase-like n=1 Tax=Actinidia eriantha TaxID=165200 RepID=UPI0025855BCE|nr:cyclic phosphodiesterase-like [Actinidia eriantha]XP_057512246.1 cyclic phosphodiesterase-like [Actinidia eriantha]
MEVEAPKRMYSVWAIPPEDGRERLKRLMSGLRSEFDGPEFEPHVTVISLTEEDAPDKFRAACHGVKAYTASVEKVAPGTFFYQCVFLLLNPTTEVVETNSHCTGHFGYKSSTRKST